MGPNYNYAEVHTPKITEEEEWGGDGRKRSIVLCFVLCHPKDHEV